MMETKERYEIRRKLGQGGVGAVYEGYDHQLRRRVAVKRLLETEESRSQEAVAELLKECHSLSALNSPHIVRLFDFGEDHDGPFVVMELLEGETLETLICRAPFTGADFMVLAEQSLEGLFAAHDAHLLHRDLKPCNFMVTWLPSGRMQLKILDFGLAKFSIEPSKQTISHENSLFGSIYFMAPEQFEQSVLDARTDLYALGTVFYYALTGVYPFDGGSVAQVMASHLTGQYRDLREYRPDLDPEVSKWVMTLISRNPDDRPDSCATALAQFMGLQRGTYSPAEPVRNTSTPLPKDFTRDDQIPTNTATVSLRHPGAAQTTGPIRLNTGPISLNTGTISLNQQGMGMGYTSHIPLPVARHPNTNLPAPPKKTPAPWLAFTGGMLAISLLIWAVTSTGRTKEEPETTDLSAEVSVLPDGETLIRNLALPRDVATLLSRRDLDTDNRLSPEEFANAPTTTRRKKQTDLFPAIDQDHDGYLSEAELSAAYQKK